MSRILVTGGAGAIGNSLCRVLLAGGHEVTVLDDLSSGHAEFLPPAVRFLEASVLDREALAAAFDPQPEYVVHLAALFANQNSVEHPEADLEANGQGMLRVLEAATRAGVQKLLYTSSSCIYGNREVMREDDGAGTLDTPYAVTKYLGELYSQYWVRQMGLNVVIARLFNCYGPYELPGPYRNVTTNFFARALRGESLTITGDGSETRDFTFVEDTVEGLRLLLLGATEPGEVFNIATGQPTPILTLAEEINRLTANPAPIEFRPRRSWDHVRSRVGVIDRIHDRLGYQPRHSLEEGLKITCEWIQQQVGPGSGEG